MSEAEIVNVILRIREQIDFLWHFYVSSCAILIGWLFSTKIHWTKEKHQVTTVLFVTFAIINLSAIYKEYSLLESALLQVRSTAENSLFTSKLAESDGLGSILSVIVHATVDVIIYQLINLRYKRVVHS